MKILYINPGGRAQGGAERSLAELIRGMVARGHEAQVLLMAPGDASRLFSEAGATVVDVIDDDLAVANRHHGALAFVAGAVKALPSIVSVVRRIRRAARAGDVDLIHSNGFRSHVLTPLYAAGRPVVWSLRDRAPRRLHRWLLAVAARRGAHVAANSTFTAEQLTSVATKVVANPVTAPANRDRDAARREFGIPTEVPLVAVLAHLHTSKGHDVAIDALASMSSSETHLAIAGGSLYSTSDEYAQQLREQCDRAGIGDRVHFLGNLDDPDGVYAAADVIVHPCRYPEGFGRVIVEAQLAGRPVIATALGGVLDLIEHQTTGWLVPPDVPSALAVVIDEILRDRRATAEVVAQARGAAENFSPAHHVARVLDVYAAALGQPSQLPTAGVRSTARQTG